LALLDAAPGSEKTPGGQVFLHLAAEYGGGDQDERGDGQDPAWMADAEVGESSEHGRPPE